MYIEGMLMRGEDLYNYKYRHKIDLPEVSKPSKNLKKGSSSTSVNN